MHGGELIREARKRAGLTQEDLADRLATTQPAIARWENGRTSPSFRRVVEAIRACGLDLSVRIATYDDQHELLIEDNLRRRPEERLRQQMEGQAGIRKLLAAVGRHGDDI
jgi:transcriptional regulator with XRE-family HTH domain